MSRARVALALALAALAGCRGVLGIETLAVTDGGAGSTSDASPDQETISDAGTDTNPATDGSSNLPPGADAGACLDSGNCQSCCHQTWDNQTFTYAAHAVDAGCFCGSGSCVTECASEICASPSNHMTPTCGGCVDKHAIDPSDPSCHAAGIACQSDPGCAVFINCLLGCPPPAGP